VPVPRSPDANEAKVTQRRTYTQSRQLERLRLSVDSRVELDHSEDRGAYDEDHVPQSMTSQSIGELLELTSFMQEFTSDVESTLFMQEFTTLVRNQQDDNLRLNETSFVRAIRELIDRFRPPTNSQPTSTSSLASSTDDEASYCTCTYGEVLPSSIETTIQS